MALTATQLKRRRGRVTSSTAAGGLGLHERMSPLQSALSMRGELSVAETAAMERGNYLEELLLEKAIRYPTRSKALELTYRPAPFRTHPRYAKWAGDSADARYLNPDGELVAIGEGKTAALGTAVKYGEEGTDAVPDGVLVQCHWHLIHWEEVDVCIVPVLVGGYAFEFRLYEVRRDPEFHGLLLQDLERFHRDYVIGDRLPPAEAVDTDTLKRLHPEHTEGLWVADCETIRELARQKDEASKAAKAAIAAEERCKNRLKQHLGDAMGCKATWGSVTYKNNRPTTSTDWRALAEAMHPTPELIAQYTRTKTGARPLCVRFNGGA